MTFSAVSTSRERGSSSCAEPEEQVLAALQHEFPAVRETQVDDQRGFYEESIRAKPKQTGRAELDFQHLRSAIAASVPSKGRYASDGGAVQSTATAANTHRRTRSAPCSQSSGSVTLFVSLPLSSVTSALGWPSFIDGVTLTAR